MGEKRLQTCLEKRKFHSCSPSHTEVIFFITWLEVCTVDILEEGKENTVFDFCGLHSALGVFKEKIKNKKKKENKSITTVN